MRPNIVIFNPDQMRVDALGHMGNLAARTPFLDSFAQNEAVSFQNAFCQNTVCVPSRCSFLTGVYPHVRGHRTMAYMLHEDEPSLLQELKDAGYYVWMNGRNDFLPAQMEGVFEKHASEIFYGGDVPDAPGSKESNPRGGLQDKNFYSFYFGEKALDKDGKNYTIDDECVDMAIKKIKNRKEGQPFCMFLGLQLPHPPYEIEEPYFSAIDQSKLSPRKTLISDYEGKPKILKQIAEYQRLQELEEKDWNQIRACYLGMNMKVDEMFEKLCSTLKEEGIYEDTAIFFFSDHGDYTGDYGIVEKTQNTFEDCLVKVPLLIKPPVNYKVDPGVTETLTELIDIYPTIMKFCGVDPMHSHFGKNLTNVIEDRNQENRMYAFSEGGRLKGELHCNETGLEMPNPYNPYYPRMMAQKDDVAHTKATMIRSKEYKYIKRLYENDEFYDLRVDPDEIVNQITNIKYKDTMLSMKEELLEWYQGTCDVVPYELDKRFSYDMIWNRVKLLCPKDLEEHVKSRIHQGEDLFQLYNWLKKTVAERNQMVGH